ncbi:hypothetical protein WA1_24790 [Scytonema hofmannii PCC 7110]|uniref:Periplasmic binding protein domain-containing protein n=1 Tax=Scytonema hofmannii PCC 7110 TaxID=128403 RepID=A0A139X882_9CYAN|nr:hypothetical protein WA1_24790 [Scytonema hofmannii PCC 7110]
MGCTKTSQIVIAVDAAVDADVDATVSSNNLQAGELACQYIGDRLKGKGNVVILNSISMDSVIQRVNGCENALSKYADIKILSKDQNAEGSRDGGLRVMSDLLTTSVATKVGETNFGCVDFGLKSFEFKLEEQDECEKDRNCN